MSGARGRAHRVYYREVGRRITRREGFVAEPFRPAIADSPRTLADAGRCPDPLSGSSDNPGGGGIRPRGWPVTTEEADRLLAACQLLGEHDEERRLLHSEIVRVDLFRSGTSDTYQVTFADSS